MDRRQQKTKEAIYQSLSRLLKKKDFNHITVQEIIDGANISRSTFYAHFETKDMLLQNINLLIFEHIFPEDWLSASDTPPYEVYRKLRHVLYHLKEDRPEILCAFSDESRAGFMENFKSYMRNILRGYTDNLLPNVPPDFKLNFLLESFCGAVEWWIQNDLQETPYEIMTYFCSCIGYHFVTMD